MLRADAGAWQARPLGEDSTDATAVPCQRASIVALGATSAHYQAYEQLARPGSAYRFNAAELEAQLPDPARAKLAADTFSLWVRTCADDGPLPDAHVQATGPGRWRLTLPGSTPGSVDVSEFGVLLVGNRMGVLFVNAESELPIAERLFAHSVDLAALRLRWAPASPR